MSSATNLVRERVTVQQRAEARAHIDFLRDQRSIPLEILKELQDEKPEYDPRLERITNFVNFTSGRLGSVLPIVSRDIYTSVDRVVLELIQNADDATYGYAECENCTPYLKFALFPGKVILEYNEDGFTRDDVNRICDVNQSNKGENDIGEKGIGFKSVFMIASKVHIESKEYSFSFRVCEGDNDMQMFTPEYEASDNPPDGCTRITLTLLEEQHIRAEALQKFREVPTTPLLFLRHIKKLSIVEHGSTITTTYEELEERGVLTRDGDSEPDVKHFHIFRQVFDEIPTEGKKRKNPNAEVKLAFPFTPDHKPLIERQPDVFARLPINSTGVGLHFLVHSDFSTSANREAVDEKSARNAVLLGKIAEVFQVAVKHFSNDPCLPLRHQWMEFLPDHSISNTFWSALRVKIESALKGTPFLRSRSGRVRLISDLRYLPEMFRDSPEERSNPLFLDLPDDEKYLHPDYEAQLERLRTLGLKDLTPEEMVDRVESDVKSKLFSCMRTNVEDIWHTHVAMFFLFCRDNHPTEWARLQELPLIPLFPGGYDNWTSNSNADVYFPTVGNVSVPTDLNISLITADAASCPARKLLFTALRVKDAPFNLVRRRIFEKYQSGHNIGLESSLSHLRFLWWTHPKDYTDDSKMYRRLHVFNEKKDQLFPLSSEIFFCSDDSFGVRELFPGDPGLILHQEYLNVLSPTQRPGHSSWKEWLRDVIGVQEYPRLVDRDNPTELSPIFERISKDCPDRVVGLLRAHWCEYNKQISEPIRQKVSDVRVPYTTGDGTSGKMKLELSDLPLPALKKACESFALDASYPFLTLPGEVADRDLTGWDCLTFFGVNKELNLQFYLWILFFFKKLKGRAVQERVFKLYVQIQCQCVQAGSCQSAQKEVRCFDKGLNVFVPTSPGSFSWNAPEECLWDAPSYMRSKIPLLARYRSITDASVPTEFFQETLLIRNTTSRDLLEELEFMRREGGDICLDNIKDIYVRLNDMRLADDRIGDLIRERFETSGLIWCQSEMSCWKPPSACLWSSKAQITDMHTMSGKYGQGEHKKMLKAFFVDCLKVAEPTLDMLAQELQLEARSLAGVELSNEDVSVNKMKVIIQAINSMSLNNYGPVREKLRSSPVFPVRSENGSLRLETAAGEFSIRDREIYWKAFNKRVPMLELTLEEVHELGPFLRWMDLESRYLSSRVTERSEFNGTQDDCSMRLTEDLRIRATAIFRCAVHFKSPRTRGADPSLFQLLSRVKVYQSSGISTYLDLSQTVNGREMIITVRSSTSTMHIEQKSKTELRIYVPSEENKRLLCYCKLFPERLMSDIFMLRADSDLSKTNTNAARVVAAVLNAPLDKNLLKDLLTEFGITQLPGWFEKNITSLETGLAGLEIDSAGSSNESDDEGGSQTSIDILTASVSSSCSDAESASSDHSARVDPANSTSTFSPLGPSRSIGIIPKSLPQLPGISSTHPQRHRLPHPIIHEDSDSEPKLDSQEEYIKLLGKIRDAAREADIPTQGPIDVSASITAIEDKQHSDSPHPTTAFGSRSVNQLKHDFKLGAAGELYVYELLSHLPPFSSGRRLNLGPSNWPSSIRDYVRVHPGCAKDFPDLEKPTPREKADIIFKDNDGDFTRYLINKGYLEAERYRGAKPEYFIEVKSTLKRCDTVFYMSKSQYRLMQAIAAQQDNTVQKIYLIFRVFDLDTHDIGLRIYADPGELNFVEYSYTVTPKVRSRSLMM